MVSSNLLRARGQRHGEGHSCSLRCCGVPFLLWLRWDLLALRLWSLDQKLVTYLFSSSQVLNADLMMLCYRSWLSSLQMDRWGDFWAPVIIWCNFTLLLPIPSFFPLSPVFNPSSFLCLSRPLHSTNARGW